MPSIPRRTLLASIEAVALGTLGGCTSLRSRDPPAGSLRFENDDTLPHSLTLRVTDVGSTPGDEPGTTRGDVVVPPAQRTLTAATTVRPGQQRTYDSVFTEPVWYAVRFTVDGRPPDDDTGETTYHPAPPDTDMGRVLAGVISEAGEFSWRISSTANAGPFTN